MIIEYEKTLFQLVKRRMKWVARRTQMTIGNKLIKGMDNAVLPKELSYLQGPAGVRLLPEGEPAKFIENHQIPLNHLQAQMPQLTSEQRKAHLT